MNKPRLHLLGIPHTIQDDPEDRYSHCAFTKKVDNFQIMMKQQGYEVIKYGNYHTSVENVSDKEVIFFESEFKKYTDNFDPKGNVQIGTLANVSSPLYAEFNSRVRAKLHAKLRKSDIICLPFGHAHNEAVRGFNNPKIETGIGYLNSSPNNFRIFESNAWRHFTIGRESIEANHYNGSDFNWVIPNYYNINEFNPDLKYKKENYIAFMGRLNWDKGIQEFIEIAYNMPDYKFKIAGQGDITQYQLPDNVEYVGVLNSKEREEYLSKALCLVALSRYVEPFCGSAVEAMLCGTPVIGSSFGAFTETIDQGENGFRSRILGDHINYIKHIEATLNDTEIERIQKQAQEKYSMEVVGRYYDKVFQQIHNPFNQPLWSIYESNPLNPYKGLN